jgi:AraC family transcriptional regulator of arabinose operon
MENHYGESVTLNRIAGAACLNHSTLTELFKAEFNMTPISYLWHHRIKVAKKFLEFTELPVGEIASRCGFKTTQHFSRKFEQLTGSAPTSFRVDAVAKRKTAF